MPLYEFRCDDCGVFDEWRRMAECALPAQCPDCQTPAKRIFSAPALLTGSLRTKRENSSPELVKREKIPAPARVHSHGGGRPWMISH
jgi:putative FmdB family regulatory protein